MRNREASDEELLRNENYQFEKQNPIGYSKPDRVKIRDAMRGVLGVEVSVWGLGFNIAEKNRTNMRVAW